MTYDEYISECITAARARAKGSELECSYFNNSTDKWKPAESGMLISKPEDFAIGKYWRYRAKAREWWLVPTDCGPHYAYPVDTTKPQVPLSVHVREVL